MTAVDQEARDDISSLFRRVQALEHDYSELKKKIKRLEDDL